MNILTVYLTISVDGHLRWFPVFSMDLSGGSDSKEFACNARDLGRSPGEGHGNPVQYSCLENPTESDTTERLTRHAFLYDNPGSSRKCASFTSLLRCQLLRGHPRSPSPPCPLSPHPQTADPGGPAPGSPSVLHSLPMFISGFPLACRLHEGRQPISFGSPGPGVCGSGLGMSVTKEASL